VCTCMNMGVVHVRAQLYGGDSGAALLAVAANALAIICGLRSRGHDPGYLALYGYVLVAMAPGLGLVQHGWVQLGGDRYAYIAMASGAVAVGAAVATAWGDGGEGPSGARPAGGNVDDGGGDGGAGGVGSKLVLLIAIAILVGTLGVLSHAQMQRWRNERAVFGYATRCASVLCMGFVFRGR
jgi:hypothetical protein